MKSSIITNETSSRHFVQNYRFKILSTEHADLSHASLPKQEIKEHTEQITQNQVEQKEQAHTEFSSVSATPASNHQNDNFVEELLKKVDEMGDNVIKLQMQIENQESEFNARLTSEVERARAEGLEAGKTQAHESFLKELDELKKQYTSSVAKLDDTAKKLDEFIAKNEAELSTTALQIAKEVIAKELEEDSAKIAVGLTKKLLAELGEAKEIKLSVNPEDASYIKQSFSDDARVSVVGDEAIAKGGVIITSDAGNIEASLSARLDKIKSMVG